MTSPFEEYRLLRLLGEGGMAQVWVAQREVSGRSLECAVKIIKPEFADDPRHREMFVREGQLSLILSGHDNIVSTLDVGEHQGRPYLAMELIDGVTLAELARRVDRPWPVAEAVGVVAGLLRALCHIHDLGEADGIVHRDVTPHNVMVSRRGEVKLMDFGIAQRADAQPSLAQALGKLRYVPREQVEGDPDPRADLYAAGAVLFELLDGRRFRWHCADEDALFQEIYRDRVPSLRRPDVPAPVLALLRGLLQPRREQRITSAEEALRGLEAWDGFTPSTDGLERLLASAIDERARSSSSRSAVSNVPRARPWDEVEPTAQHPRSHPWLMAEDVRPPSRVSTEPHPHSAVAVANTDEIAVAEGTPVGRSGESSGGSVLWPEGGPEGRPEGGPEGLPPFSRPAWAAQSEPSCPRKDRNTLDVAATRVVPASQSGVRLGADPMERQLTRRYSGRHPGRRSGSEREQDAPMARNSVEIAVTEPQPSRHAPWAEGTKPIVPFDWQGVQREPGAPAYRRRPRSDRGADGSDGSDPFEPLGSVSPRTRESAAMHEAATDADMVTGEIIIDDDLGEEFLPPPWRADISRVR
ncbi:MAG: serine/threonine-protein kinase [Myxococcota bacterium]